MSGTFAIVQARMGSTRLPGKVMKEIVGKPMLELMIERLRRASELDGIIVATSDKDSERPIVDLVGTLDGIGLFRGSEEDVLSRYHGAALRHGADTVVRLTADCPLIEPEVIDKVVGTYNDKACNCDYASNVIKRTYPRGLDVEAFSFEALDRAFGEAHLQGDREHVTPYIWRHPDMFRLCDVTGDTDRSHLRWTVDAPEDLRLVTKIYESLYFEKRDFSYDDVLQLLETNPEWNAINAHVEQKTYGQQALRSGISP